MVMMRQGQHNKRSRNRNRRPPSPVNRVYESNGPDVKIRGTAQHIAEKYLALARDAQVSGDWVSGENFFQHAEHYLRILAAAQAYSQQQQQQPQTFRRPGFGEPAEFEEGYEGDEPGSEAGDAQEASGDDQPRGDGNGLSGGEPQREHRHHRGRQRYERRPYGERPQGREPAPEAPAAAGEQPQPVEPTTTG